MRPVELNFKLSLLSTDICVYYATENQQVNVYSTWCLPLFPGQAGLCTKGVIWPIFFQNNTSRIIILKEMVIPMINELYDDEEFYFQQGRESPNYSTNVRRLLNEPSLENGLGAKVRFTGLLGRLIWHQWIFYSLGSCKTHGLCKKPELNKIVEFIKDACREIDKRPCRNVCTSVY